MICPRFVDIDEFFSYVFIMFCHSEDNTAMLTIRLYLLNAILDGVRVFTIEIAAIVKTGTDSRRPSF